MAATTHKKGGATHYFLSSRWSQRDPLNGVGETSPSLIVGGQLSS